MKKVLITGAHGFLGRNVAAAFNHAGFEVHGIGFGTWPGEDPADFGISNWRESPVTLDALEAMNCEPEVIVHCAGSGSVGFSLANPYDDFRMTVDTTASVLEYLRVAAPRARLIYPSSAAVYGCRHEGLLSETFLPDPISPYGVHKLMAEQLCFSVQRNFGINCRIVRFFSLYGPGLRKQLLWDASRRLSVASDVTLEFFGTGKETRDWLHVRDAAALILKIAGHDSPPVVVNGASGEGHSVREILTMLKDALGSPARIAFNGQIREGDPEHLEAEIRVADSLGWLPEIKLQDGLREYAGWFKNAVK